MTRWEEWARENVDRNALYDDTPRLPAVTEGPRQCSGCDHRFTPARGNQVWCSSRCRHRDAMSKKRARDYERAEQELRFDDLHVLVR